MLKKALIIIVSLVLIIPVALAYYCFWPRYIFKSYGYHDIETENKHCKWWITLDTSDEESDVEIDLSKWWNRVNPHLKKINVYGAPYHLSIWHNLELKVDKVEIMKSQTVVFNSNDGERIIHKGNDGTDSVVTIYQELKLDYDDYDLIVYYSIEDQGKVVDYTLKEAIKTDFIEEKVSLFEVLQGI